MANSNTSTIKTRAGSVEIHCYYDDQDRSNRGWYASFTRRDARGEIVERDDTMKIWSVEMEKLAWSRARGHARRMLAAARKRGA